MKRSLKFQLNRMLLCLSIFTTSSFIFAQVRVGQEILGTSLTDSIGKSIAISHDGSVCAVGAPGEQLVDGSFENGTVKVYKNNNGAWQQLGSTLKNRRNEIFGRAIALSADGTILAVNTTTFSRAKGMVVVYKYANDTWSILGDTIKGNNSFGNSLSLSYDGKTLAVGEPSNHPGYVKVYKFNSSSWEPLGNPLKGQAVTTPLSGTNEELFGSSVALSGEGNVLVVTAPCVFQLGGRVAIYKLENSEWIKDGEDLKCSDVDLKFGAEAAISGYGNILVVEAKLKNGVPAKDRKIYTFRKGNVNWEQLGSPILTSKEGDWINVSLSLSGDGTVLAVGGQNHAVNSDLRVGSVQIYKLSGSQFSKIGNEIVGKGRSAHFGAAVSLSGNGRFVAVGAPSVDFLGYSEIYSLYDFLKIQDVNQETAGIKLYPNPVQDFLTIENATGSGVIRDVRGAVVSSFAFEANQTKFDLSAFNAGVYLLEITSLNGEIETYRIVR